MAQVQPLHPLARRHEEGDVGGQFPPPEHRVDAAHDLAGDALHSGGLLDEEAAVDEELRPRRDGGCRARAVLRCGRQDAAKP